MYHYLGLAQGTLRESPPPQPASHMYFCLYFCLSEYYLSFHLHSVSCSDVSIARPRPGNWPGN